MFIKLSRKSQQKKTLILDQSNIPPDMMNTIRNNNAFEDEFWKTHNPYKNTPHIDSKPKYTPPYYAPQETGFGSFNYESYVQNCHSNHLFQCLSPQPSLPAPD